MKLAVSNIAWGPEQDAAAYALLREENISLLELAPPRFWPEPEQTPAAAVAETLEQLRAEGFAPTAFQAILFGKPDHTVFESDERRHACLAHLSALARIAALCGIRPLVFGAPKNRRIPEGMAADEAEATGVAFFSALAKAAVAEGVCFCLEPNPTGYGCNYATNVGEAAAVVRKVASEGLRLQIDAGALAMNDEDVKRVVSENMDIVGHVHISQPMLDDFSNPWPGHTRLSGTLQRSGYEGVISLEMKTSPRGLPAIREAISFLRRCYGAA